VHPQIYCLNASSGDIVWNVSDIIIWASPALAYDNLYIGGLKFIIDENGNRVPGPTKFYCFDALTGEQKWNNSCFPWYSTPAVFDDKIVVSHYPGEIMCFDAFNGDLLWNYSTNCSIYCSPSIADNKVFVAIGAGEFGCLNLSTGKLIWKFDTFRVNFFDSSPAIADGRVFTGTFKGFVYAFGEPNKQPNDPIVSGETNGKTGNEYVYTFLANDSDGYELWYFIDWGDDTDTGWIGPYSSGEEIKLKYKWSEEGNYMIKAKVRDIYNYESNWGTLEVYIPRNKPTNFNFLSWFLERFPLLERLLTFLLL
jgi:outer membrane protein assembly factor BamB